MELEKNFRKTEKNKQIGREYMKQKCLCYKNEVFFFPTPLPIYTKCRFGISKFDDFFFFQIRAPTIINVQHDKYQEMMS